MPAAALLLALLGAAPASAEIAGRVLDAAREPIAGARVCYLLGTQEKDCTATGEDGRFVLPEQPYDRVRIVAEGHLPRVLPARSPGEPIVLEPTPVLSARIVDARTGRALRGQLSIVYATGESRGPFPANEAGVSIRRLLQPGTVRVVAIAPGYRESRPREVILEAGREATVVIELEPASERPGS